MWDSGFNLQVLGCRVSRSEVSHEGLRHGEVSLGDLRFLLRKYFLCLGYSSPKP